MLKLRFDQYITKRFLILICFVFFVISRCVAAYYWNFKILERFEKKGWQNDVCLNVYTINTVLLMVFAHSLFLHQKFSLKVPIQPCRPKSDLKLLTPFCDIIIWQVL